MNVPKWLAYVFLISFVVMTAICWRLSILIVANKSYDIGAFDERNKNPTKEYIESGSPFLWYKGTYYRVRNVGPKTFKVTE